MTERETQREILAAYGAHPRLRLARFNVGVGWFAKGKPARKTDSGAYPVKFGIPGLADVCGILAPEGRLVCIEVKTDTGTQSPEQKTMQRIVTKFGGIYVLARNLADVDRAFAELGVFR